MAVALGGYWKPVLGLAVSVGLLALFVLTVDVRGFARALTSANYLYVLPAIGVYLLAMAVRTLRWQMMLNHLKPVPLPRLFQMMVVGFMANALLPLRLGDVVRSYQVGERENISKTSVLATVVAERILDALVLLLFLDLIVLFVPLTEFRESLSLPLGLSWNLMMALLTLVMALAFGALVGTALAPGRTKSLISFLLRPLPVGLHKLVMDRLAMLLDGLRPLRRLDLMARLLFLTVLVWVLEAGVFFTIGYAFSFQTLFDGLWAMALSAILVTSLVNIAGAIPAAPGGLGVFDILAREIVVAVPYSSVPREIAGAYAAVMHATLALPLIVLGQVFLWWGQASLLKIRRAIGRSEEPPARVSAPE